MGQIFEGVSKELLEESRMFYINKEKKLKQPKNSIDKQSNQESNNQKQPFNFLDFILPHLKTVSACILFVFAVAVFVIPAPVEEYSLTGPMPVTLQEGKGISGCNLGEDIVEVYPKVTGTINSFGKTTIIINTMQSKDWERDAAYKIEDIIKYIVRHRSKEIKISADNNDLIFLVRRPYDSSPYIFSMYLLPYTAIAGYDKDDDIDNILFVSQLKYYGGNKRLWKKELM